MTYGPPQRFREVFVCEEKAGETGIVFDLKDVIVMKKLYESKLYQSTGHHDANGKEIFFGDVLLNIEPRMAVHPGVFVTVVFIDGQIFMRCDGVALDMSDPPAKGDYRIKKCDSFAVIGNHHMSPEALLAESERLKRD